MKYDDAVKEALQTKGSVVVYEGNRLVGCFDPYAPGLIDAHRFRSEIRDYQVTTLTPGETVDYTGARKDGKN